MEMLGDQTESIKENMLREEGVAEFDPASVNGSESLSRRQCWDEWTEYFEGVVGVGGGWGANKHKMPLKNEYVVIIFLCSWCFCVCGFVLGQMLQS